MVVSILATFHLLFPGISPHGLRFLFKRQLEKSARSILAKPPHRSVGPQKRMHLGVPLNAYTKIKRIRETVPYAIDATFGSEWIDFMGITGGRSLHPKLGQFLRLHGLIFAVYQVFSGPCSLRDYQSAGIHSFGTCFFS